jgi:NitT/TauT family transport system permease protein
MKPLRSLLAVSILILLWQFGAPYVLNTSLIPPPSQISIALVEMARTGELLSDISVSMRRVLIGFALGSVAGTFVGLLTGRIKFLTDTLGQIIQVLRPIPVIALVPLAIVWFGIGETSKYFLVFWGVFFPVWLNTHLGASSIEQRYIWAAQSLGAGRQQLFYSVIFPSSLPMIIAGMRTGIAIGFVCVVAAEMSGAFGGIGYRIYASHMVFRVDKMMAGIVVLGLLGAIADRCFAFVVGRVFPWLETRNT